jgi:hypothetical protein
VFRATVSLLSICGFSLLRLCYPLLWAYRMLYTIGMGAPKTKREIDHERGLVRCTKCREWKPPTEYYANNSVWGIMPHCKECHKAHQKERYLRVQAQRARESVRPFNLMDLTPAARAYAQKLEEEEYARYLEAKYGPPPSDEDPD